VLQLVEWPFVGRHAIATVVRQRDIVSWSTLRTKQNKLAGESLKAKCFQRFTGLLATPSKEARHTSGLQI
jgi:hypothetical protein